MILAIDTETTGKVDFRVPPSHESQPDLVEMALILAEPETLRERAVFCGLVRPNGWKIPTQATEIHGVTTEMAVEWGFELVTVLAMWRRLLRLSTTIVAHNLEFDLSVIDTARYRCARVSETLDQMIGDRARFCTMKEATPICKIPHAHPRRPDDWKYPKLEECMKHFFGEDSERHSHRPLDDARACLRIFGALRGQ